MKTLLSALTLILGIFVCSAQTGTTTNTVQVTIPATIVTTTTTNIPDLLGSIGGSPALSHSLQELWDVTAGSTNGAFLFGGGRGLAGNKNVAFVDYLYNLNQNAGLLFGYDYLFSNSKSLQSSANVVKGGFNLQANIRPLQRFGLTNFIITPFAAILIATPLNGTSNNGGIGQIALTGVDWESSSFKIFNFPIKAHVGGFYENRTGQGGWNGNYLCAHFALSYGW